MASIDWHDDAKEYAQSYGLTPDDVELIVTNKTNPQLDPRSHEVGHLIVRYRAGDVIVVVGYREPKRPVIMSVMVDHHHESRAGSKAPGGAGKTGPTTMKALVKRILDHGYRVEMGGSHYRVVDKVTGEFLMSLPVTPSDHRSIPNAWSSFLNKDAQAKRMRGKAS
jgi:hypothetical protein